MRLEKLNGTQTDTPCAHYSQNEKCLLYIAFTGLELGRYFCHVALEAVKLGQNQIGWASTSAFQWMIATLKQYILKKGDRRFGYFYGKG